MHKICNGEFTINIADSNKANNSCPAFQTILPRKLGQSTSSSGLHWSVFALFAFCSIHKGASLYYQNYPELTTSDNQQQAICRQDGDEDRTPNLWRKSILLWGSLAFFFSQIHALRMRAKRWEGTASKCGPCSCAHVQRIPHAWAVQCALEKRNPKTNPWFKTD